MHKATGLLSYVYPPSTRRQRLALRALVLFATGVRKIADPLSIYVLRVVQRRLQTQRSSNIVSIGDPCLAHPSSTHTRGSMQRHLHTAVQATGLGHASILKSLSISLKQIRYAEVRHVYRPLSYPISTHIIHIWSPSIVWPGPGTPRLVCVVHSYDIVAATRLSQMYKLLCQHEPGTSIATDPALSLIHS